jgi:hypothetical protein
MESTDSFPSRSELLSVDEILNAMTFTRVFEKPDDIAISDIKKDWIVHFTPLLKYYCSLQPENRITSNDLTALWQFFVDGKNNKRSYEGPLKKNVDYLLSIKNPLRSILNDDVTSIIEHGTFLYQMAYYLEIINLRVPEIIKRYEKLYYDTDDPVVWFQRNNNSWDFPISPEKDILNLWVNIRKAIDPNLDPVMQR